MRALSIRQPYAEQILRRTKRVEFRSRATTIRGRIYVYAAKRPGPIGEFRKMGLEPGDLPTGVLVGTVEVAGCAGRGGDHRWELRRPKRLARPLRPTRHPQPAWFNPF